MISRCSVHAMMSPFKTMEFEFVRRNVGQVHKLLDVGCGAGTQTMALSRQSLVVLGLDHSAKEIAKANLRADALRTFKVADGANYRFANNYDVVTMICVLEHIKDHDGSMSSAFKALRPGGKIVLTCDGEEIRRLGYGGKHAFDHGVVRYYTPNTLRETMKRAGFVDVSTEYLFRSGYARRLFNRCLIEGFKRGPVRYFPELVKLRLAEMLTFGDETGLFVCGVGYKPGAGEGGGHE